jgi:hypothetical protein
MARTTAKHPARKTRRPARKWSAAVTRRSDALDIEGGIFAGRSPEKIARSLKHSAEHSRRRKAGPFQSAMSMLNFYINRGGTNLSAGRKRVLTQAKGALRRLFKRT